MTDIHNCSYANHEFVKPAGVYRVHFWGDLGAVVRFHKQKRKNWVFKMLLKFILKVFFFFYQNTQIITLFISNYDKTWPNNSAE